MIRRALMCILGSLAMITTIGALPANAACYEQRTFTGREGGIYEYPGGPLVGYWYGKQFTASPPDKINVHRTWNSSWIGGNVYMWNNQKRATGYVLKQYTEHTRWIC